MSPPPDWKDTFVISALAAAFGGLLVAQLLQKTQNHSDNDSSQGGDGAHHDSYNHPLLENPRARSNSTKFDDEIVVDSRFGGWSMAEAQEVAASEHAKQAAMTPAEVLRSLQKGNSRFWSGHASRPERSAFHRRALIARQFPSTAVLGCSDSRVPVELVFDQGLGDMFVIRVAGNCLGTTTEGSLQYAVHHLGIKVLLVMGHEGCGAIKAAQLPVDQIDKEPQTLAAVLKSIKMCLPKEEMDFIFDARARDREAVAINVKQQVIKLVEDPDILKKIDQGKMKVVGAFYEISSGIVDFFMQVARHEPGTPFKPSPGVQSRYNPITKEIVYG